MRSFLAEFEKRRSEVRRYLAVMVVAERELERSGPRRHDEELKIFRAGALLIIYNAVEASARLGILAIYDEIGRTGTTFDQLREKFRVRILNDFKNNVGADRLTSLRHVAIDLIASSFDPQKLFSGNVDAKKLREAGTTYGFETNTEFALTQHGAHLLTVKTRRQDLAHGTESFSEVGKQYTTDDVIRIARYSLAYMSAILRHIDTYLDLEGYREPIPEPPPPVIAAGVPVLRRVRELLSRSLARVWEGRHSR
ncbi:MAG: MAE_28990/MAE_18760 family HEPN-like nuclease [Sphingomonas sp.]|uniref:MAE_28990/MAE_18760 family HEPN-like nuclease n=1 Tax=Sphingomonas sp. TaxID=28214 RepID=UPI0035641C58